MAIDSASQKSPRSQRGDLLGARLRSPGAKVSFFESTFVSSAYGSCFSSRATKAVSAQGLLVVRVDVQGQVSLMRWIYSFSMSRSHSCACAPKGASLRRSVSACAMATERCLPPVQPMATVR